MLATGWRSRACALALATAGLAAPRPAAASMLPSLDFHAGETLLTLGLGFDAGMDFAIDDRSTWGVSGGLPLLYPGIVAVRYTRRVDGEAGDAFAWGYSIASGYTFIHMNPFSQYGSLSGPPSRSLGGLFVQPAMIWQFPLWNTRLSATLGPIFYGDFTRYDTYTGI